MKKTILAILLCGVMVFGITGCKEKKKENSNTEEYTIVDKMQEQKDLTCADALQNFYTDENYSYYWSCIKDDYIVVRYKDGMEEKVSDALKSKKISISDLDRFNIDYSKEEKKINISDGIEFYITKPQFDDDVGFIEYYIANDRIIYLSGNLEEFYIKEKDKDITLKEYLSTAYQTLDDGIKHITDELELQETLRDGGTKIYKSNDKDITMIVCNTTKNDKNVFIGDYSLKYTDGDCKN